MKMAFNRELLRYEWQSNEKRSKLDLGLETRTAEERRRSNCGKRGEIEQNFVNIDLTSAE